MFCDREGRMSEPKMHLVVATPCYGGQVMSSYAASLLKLQAACTARGIEITIWMSWGDALITRARQDLTARFLGTPSATHLLFVDADIAFEPEQAFRLLDFAADFSAGVYPAKKYDWPKVEALVKEGRGSLESASLSYVMEFENPARIESKGGFAKVRYAGTGFMLLKRRALEKMVDWYPELKYGRHHQNQDSLRDSPWRYALFNCILDQATNTYLSEDFSFCQRWTDKGGEIWLDLQSRLTHIGPAIFPGDVSTQFGPVSG